ncbi:uncharacterized protein SCHCODRAFT_02553112 [Schizophyllum commune H4-8]|uniref:F-box domain-containing protein n=1 Tax=Schizophyllum commune (strain H4-8 / FGSC 9210) TaxID=578458 RepID=D8QFW9_SCHCM
MPQSLDDLPNELLEQITSYSEVWEKRPPPSSSIFGVLSRVNRRLRDFALPQFFATLHLPLTDVSFAVPTISAGPFVRLLALIRSNPIYGNSIRDLIVGHKFYPFFDLFYIGSANASLSASRYAWEVFGAERPSPWLNLESFACLDMSCGPATIEALQSCANLRSLTLAWDDTTYPDLDGFPNLESLRLAGKAISWDTPSVYWLSMEE